MGKKKDEAVSNQYAETASFSFSIFERMSRFSFCRIFLPVNRVKKKKGY